MIYLISNIHRSGSSMMMRCLEAGGLFPSYRPEAELDFNASAPENYAPNPNGFYQFGGEVDSSFNEVYDGKLVKLPIRDLLKLPQGDYKLVLLKRNPAEIRASMARWTPYTSWGRDEVITYFYDLYFDTLVTELSERTDISITILNYADIVANPEQEFVKLLDAGWSFDVASASALVDESLYRLRLEQT